VRNLTTSVVWVVCMAATTYGHVALKMAVHGRGASAGALARALWSPWAISGFAAWGLSSALWMRVLATESLFGANATASIKYVLLGLASFFVLRESVTLAQWAGFALIAAGVWLVR